MGTGVQAHDRATIGHSSKRATINTEYIGVAQHDNPASVRSRTKKRWRLLQNREQSDSGTRIWASGKTRQTFSGLSFCFHRSYNKHQKQKELYPYCIFLRVGFLENFLADGSDFSKKICIKTFFFLVCTNAFNFIFLDPLLLYPVFTN